jgi:hypothetical protein
VKLFICIYSHVTSSLNLCIVPFAVLSRCPEDPSKTRITIIAHANPGGGLPKWAAKTAVNALAPIEPFKLFHKINENVKQNQPQLRERLKEAEMVSTMPPGRSPRPGGIAQLGYACYWPKGGGNIENNSNSQSNRQLSQQRTSETETENSNETNHDQEMGTPTLMKEDDDFSNSGTSEQVTNDAATEAFSIAPDST